MSKLKVLLEDEVFMERVNSLLDSHYLNSLKPKEEEEWLRNWIVRRIGKLLERSFEGRLGEENLQVFGSFAYNLYLSGGGDVDISISPSPSSSSEEAIPPPFLLLSTICESLKSEPWVSYSSILFVDGAKVPVLKFKTKPWMGGIAVDIVSPAKGDDSGHKATLLVSAWLGTHSRLLTPLTLILKSLLITYHHNSVWNGGLGGFALINMIMAILLLNNDDIDHLSLAQAFISFLYFYSTKFNTTTHCISILKVGEKQQQIFQKLKDVKMLFGMVDLVIIDPTNPSNNISKSSYNYNSIVLDFKDTLKSIIKSYDRWVEKRRLPELIEALFMVETFEKPRQLACYATDRIRRVIYGLGLDISKENHLDQIDEFLRPSSKDYYKGVAENDWIEYSDSSEEESYIFSDSSELSSLEFQEELD